ncbi:MULTISPECIES: hypothetical protein [Bacillaceae]|uniref:Uncharacterized protein n=2 Tax=Bacillaceae TaxID=186817 RepID=A0A856M6G6_9BACI|nr:MULTISPECIES: hypothetical protein [Bacillaceae]AMK74833.1 hypothetical protein AWV81_22310 [Bacillus subtilis subsp. natto]API45160.1 hypothetical protein BSR08_22485 [Bacillus subtilis]API45240.1 hypothetical protein BSR08_22890 [Bacillus subtilis]API98515.1 hypothetical protein BKP58_22200 [Bacillus subtilis]ASB72363.1 hypothetical protein S100333_04504 [Bacillus subtilis subsp. subtilis]
MIIVKIDFGDYQLNVYLEGDYQKEQKRLGDAFEEAMYKKAIAQTKKDGWALPPLKRFFEVTE